MKSYLLLLKMNMTASWNALRSEGWKKDNGKTDVGKTLLYAFALLSLAVLAGMVIYLEVALYDVMAAIGQEKLLMGLAILLSMVVTLMFGIPQTLSALYLSRDTASLAHLPLKGRTVLAVKWTQVYLNELIISLAFLLPLVVLHGLRVGGIVYWPMALTALLMSPVFPLAICLLLASVLGRLTSLTKHKDLWLAIGSMLMVALVLLAEMSLMPQIPDDADISFFMGLIMDNEGMLNFLIGAFPPVLWTVQSIAGSAGYWLLTMAVGTLSIALLMVLLGPSYLNVCLRHTEQGTQNRRSARTGRGQTSFAPHTPLMAVFHREMNEVLRIPTYFLNGAMTVMMPAIMLMSMSIGLRAADDGGEALQHIVSLWGQLSPIDQMLILSAFLGLLCWVDTLPATCISREGKRLQITRMIPVPALTIVQAKLLVSLVINAVGAALMCVAGAFLLGAACIPQLIGAFVLVNLLSYAMGVVNMAADVLKPSFNWKNETEAVKQNMNSLIGMLFTTLALVLLVAPPLVFMGSTTPAVRLMMVLGVLLLLCAAAAVLLRKLVAPRYARLEP